MITGFKQDGMWWFRVFGYGLHWKNIDMHGLLFSERVLGKGLRIGSWMFKILTP
jgi:hypothetical protein